jgi:uncharacterized damage-inducible protein DinB
MQRAIPTAVLVALAMGSCRVSAPEGRTRTDLLVSLRQEVIRYLQYWERRLFDQFDRIPEDKLVWRPAPDTRSAREVALHIAAQNYAIATMAGLGPPKGVEPHTFERAPWSGTHTRAAVVGSFGHLRTAINNASMSALDANVNFHGKAVPLREALIKNMMHTAEHVGQLLAYARMVGATVRLQGR